MQRDGFADGRALLGRPYVIERSAALGDIYEAARGEAVAPNAGLGVAS